MRLMFVAPARNISHALRRGRLTDLRSPASSSVPGHANITVTRPLKLFPNSVTAGRKCNEALARLHVRRAARALGMDRPLLWLNPHYAVHMAARMGERGVIYDITDDWISLTQSRRLRDLTAAQDAELCRRADAVIVCSQRLYDMKRPLARNLHLIPNGVDADHYLRVLDGEGLLPPVAQEWRSPVLGYTGTIHPDRVDVDLLVALAKGVAPGTVALVGPNHLPASDLARLAACGNVVLTGPVPYAELPQYMRAFDVCIVPHRVTPFTESLNPIKLWEYLAAGKPIVSTDVAGFRDYPELVRVARSAESFRAAAAAALHEHASQSEARRQEARRHSWESRLDVVEEVMRLVGQRRAAHACTVR